MCGIGGYSGAFDAALLERMNRVLAHRGPDDAGSWSAPERGLGLTHRRLSIIDLSPLGRQPMHDVTGSLVIAYNGELYNYRELRAELVAQGYGFRSQTDTEVLLNLWLRDGPDMLARLNGIYAFALYDRRDDRLLLARDGLGVKPLYLAETPRGLLFASEIKALLQEPSLSRELDPLAIQHHLAYMWCPAPRTMLRAVRKLEPGEAAVVRGGAIERRFRFYDLPYAQPIAAMGPDQAAASVREAVEEAVRRQLVADVPVGSFLSGGLDSSAVVAMARRHAGPRRLQCFTIAFRGASFAEEGFDDDLAYARRVATALDVDLHEIEVGPDMIDRLETMLYHLDEPQADPAPLHVLAICELARSHGIKVLLSGAGGDDIFTGYRRHRALELERWWSWLPRPARAALAGGAGRVKADSAFGRRLRRALAFAALDGPERIASYFLWLEPERIQALLGPALREAVGGASPLDPLLATLARLPAGTPDLHRMLYLEGKHFLADHNLNYADKLSMAVGVEVRVPLLDPDLVALAARIPPSLKQRGGVGKWVFKRAMEGVLPAEVIHRPKTGFGAPMRRWLRHELAPIVEDVLAEPSLRRRGLLDPHAVRRLVEDDRAGRLDASYPIFALICLELWCRLFLDGGARRYEDEAAACGGATRSAAASK